MHLIFALGFPSHQNPNNPVGTTSRNRGCEPTAPDTNFKHTLPKKQNGTQLAKFQATSIYVIMHKAYFGSQPSGDMEQSGSAGFQPASLVVEVRVNDTPLPPQKTLGAQQNLKKKKGYNLYKKIKKQMKRITFTRLATVLVCCGCVESALFHPRRGALSSFDLRPVVLYPCHRAGLLVWYMGRYFNGTSDVDDASFTYMAAMERWFF